MLWSAATTLELRKEELAARRQTALLALLVSVALGLVLGWGWANTPGVKPGWWSPDFTGYLVWPFYIVGIAICIGVALTAIESMARKVSPPMVYAVTSARVLACDEQGEIVDEVSAIDIERVEWRKRMTVAVLEVRRKSAFDSRRVLLVRNVSDLKAAAALLLGR